MNTQPNQPQKPKRSQTGALKALAEARSAQQSRRPERGPDEDPLVFFGSGPVAAESLRLLAERFTIEAVVTKPRPPHHKGQVPVIAVAETLGLTVLTAATKAELDRLFKLRPVSSTLAVLIDFGIIVSQSVIDYFPLGIINSHFSLLPEWRGADPITFAVLSGQKQTGVSLMLLVEAMDEGPLLGYGDYDLPSTITTPELTDDLVRLSNALLTQIIPDYRAGTILPTSQDMTGKAVSYSRKLTKEDSLLDWSKSAAVLEREIRAFAGWPRSRTTLLGKDVIITKARVIPGNGQPGTLYTEARQFGVYTADGILLIDSLLPAGKKEMSASAFLAGYSS